MTTIQFINAILNWLLADPTHTMIAASAIAAITPTPAANTVGGKAYKVLDLLALNFMHAKETGVTPSQIAQEVAALLASKSNPATSDTQEK